MIELATLRECKCALCEEGRFIKRLVALLPEAEANELSDWYCALLDHTCDKDMTLYWITQKLEDLRSAVTELGKSKALTACATAKK